LSSLYYYVLRMLAQFVYICEGFTGCIREPYGGIDKATIHQSIKNANAPH
jgi:hypothetical protein